jgi:hypothetical protein
MQFAFKREVIAKRVRENRDRHIADADESYQHFCAEALDEIADYRRGSARWRVLRAPRLPVRRRLPVRAAYRHR